MEEILLSIFCVFPEFPQGFLVPASRFYNSMNVSPNLGIKQFDARAKHRLELLVELGWTTQQIADYENRSISAVNRWKKRKAEDPEMERKVGSGKKPKLSHVEQHNVVRFVRQYPESTAAIVKSKLMLSQVSESTICRILRYKGQLKCRFATRKPFISLKNRKARLIWAKEHLNWTPEQWANVIWSDESPFYFRSQGRKRVWRPLGMRLHKKYCQGTVKHDHKIMVWGCFTRHGIGTAHHIEGIMDAPYYTKMISKRVPETINKYRMNATYIYQQDNDPKHTAIHTREFFAQNKVRVMKWPSQSPDLNPIENVWSEINRLTKDRNITTKLKCWEFFQEAWSKIQTSFLEKLVDSMPKRCADVIKAKGYSIDY